MIEVKYYDQCKKHTFKVGEVYNRNGEEIIVIHTTLGGAITNSNSNGLAMLLSKTLVVDGSSLSHWENEVVSGEMVLVGEVSHEKT